jgi:hypothetical protein
MVFIENKVCCIDFGLAGYMGLGFVWSLFLKACNVISQVMQIM